MTDVENVVPTATYSDYELAIGAATSEAAGSVSTEIVIGILTGGASRYGRVGQGIAIVDAASNVGSGIAAGIDIAENGANTSNLLQLGGSLAGATAQVAGRTRFGGPKHADVPSVKAPKTGDKVTRNFGGEADLNGRSWTRDPVPQQSRDSLGLPDVNTGEFQAHGRLKDIDGVTSKRADRIGDNLGGGDELVVPRSRDQIDLDAVTMPDRPL